MRKEQILDLKIFLFLINLRVCDSYCFCKQAHYKNDMKNFIREFKRRIACDLASKNTCEEEKSAKCENHFFTKICASRQWEQDKWKNYKARKMRFCNTMKRKKLATAGCLGCNLPFCIPYSSKYRCPSVIAKDNEKIVTANLNISTLICLRKFLFNALEL